MSEKLSLKAELRKKTGKNANRRLRANGIIPAVFYKAGGESFPVQVNEAALYKLYAATSRTTLFTLELDGNSHACLVWDIEYHPTKKCFHHVDFYGVDLEKELRVRVPLDFTGTARGTKQGGKLEVYREFIHILSKPENLPQKIAVDISDLDVGQGLRVADLTMPQGVRAHYDINFAIITVVMPGAAKDDLDEGEEEGAADGAAE